MKFPTEDSTFPIQDVEGLIMGPLKAKMEECWALLSKKGIETDLASISRERTTVKYIQDVLSTPESEEKAPDPTISNPQTPSSSIVDLTVEKDPQMRLSKKARAEDLKKYEEELEKFQERVSMTKERNLLCETYESYLQDLKRKIEPKNRGFFLAFMMENWKSEDEDEEEREEEESEEME